MVVLGPEVLHELFGGFRITVRGPHGGYVHIIRRRACNFHKFRRHEAVIPQHRLVHAHIPHFLQDEAPFLVVACHHHGVGIHVVDFRKLGGEVRILVGKSFRSHDFHPLIFQRFLEGFIGGHLVFVIIGVEHRHPLVAQKLMGFLHGLGNVFRFRHAVPEHVVTHIHEPFRRGGYAQKGNLRLLEEGAHGFVFAGNQGAHHDDLFGGNQLLGGRYGLLHIALGIHHFHIHVDFSFPVDFLHRHVKAFLFRQAIGSYAAGNAVDKAYFRRLPASRTFSLSAAAGKSCTCSCHHEAKACQFKSLFPVHHFGFSFG